MTKLPSRQRTGFDDASLGITLCSQYLYQAVLRVSRASLFQVKSLLPGPSETTASANGHCPSSVLFPPLQRPPQASAPSTTLAASVMSFMGGPECSTSGNPLSQFQKHVQDDKTLQRDRLVGRGPGGQTGGFRNQAANAPQDEVTQTP